MSVLLAAFLFEIIAALMALAIIGAFGLVALGRVGEVQEPQPEPDAEITRSALRIVHLTPQRGYYHGLDR